VVGDGEGGVVAYEHFDHTHAELSRRDVASVAAQVERVPQDSLTTALNSCRHHLLHLVDTPGVEGHPDSLLVAVVAVAALEHLFDDRLHAGVDHVLHLRPQPLILINTLGDNCVNVLAFHGDVQVFAGAQGQAQGVIVLLQVVEALRGDGGRQLRRGKI